MLQSSLIGIAPFRMVNARERFVGVRGGFVNLEESGGVASASGCSLEPNHTSFVFVENPDRTWGGEIQVRRQYSSDLI